LLEKRDDLGEVDPARKEVIAGEAAALTVGGGAF
jgi:hypothetical protein